ncbi:MAG: HAD family hydrolase [Verrucomicrobiae bacterium]|nr:HAD family hydrolase [Verrucomicrobiae bacterium]
MKVRAVIFDIYATLLQVGLPPKHADEEWQQLFKDLLHREPPLGRLEFSIACNRAIMLRHNSAKARGIACPEVVWAAVIRELLPDFAKLKASQKEEFIYRQIQIGRSISLMPGAGETLRWLDGKKCALGIASNAQAYTIREVDAELQKEGCHWKMFDADLCYLSYRFGFSKPDPYGFQILRTRLEARGIDPNETLMVGDRLDNDIAPARLHGFQTWHLKSPSPEAQSGPWKKLHAHLMRAL